MGDQKKEVKVDHKTEEVLKILEGEEIPTSKEDLAKFIAEFVDEKVLMAKKENSHIEKEKLYGQLKALKDENKKYKTDIDSFLKLQDEKQKKEEELIKQQEEEKQRLEDEKKKAEMSLSERIKLLELELNSSTAKTEEVKKKSEEILNKAVEFTKEELRKKDLQIYMQKVINESGGEIIPDLVTGNTVEEVDASVERAKKRYQELIAKKLEMDAQNKLNSGSVPKSTNDKVINKQLAIDNIWELDSKSFNEYAETFIQSLMK